jgi:ketosteroid isomerase-like protein
MTSTAREVAEAFSGHRFADAYDRLAPDVTWVLVGEGTVLGRDAVEQACDELSAELEGTRVETQRFVSVVDEQAAAVDSVTAYTAADGSRTVVSSCDVYELEDDVVVRITSYNVELDESSEQAAQAAVEGS